MLAQYQVGFVPLRMRGAALFGAAVVLTALSAPAPAQKRAFRVEETTISDIHRAILARQLTARHLTEADVRAFVRQVAVRQAIGAALTSDASQQAQAFSVWLIGAMQRARVEVNPRFGTLDPQTAQVQPITSTDQLP